MRRARLLSGLAAVGVAIGLLGVVLGVPYGRANPAAFAELYHGGVDATGQVHLAIDCDLGTPGTQDECALSAWAPTAEIGVTISNATGADLELAYFNFDVVTNQTKLNPLPNTDNNLNGNPDLQEAFLSLPGWSCTPPPPMPDWNANPAIADSFISCVNPSNAAPLPADSQHHLIAVVRYAIVAPAEFPVVPLDLTVVNVTDSLGMEYLACEPGGGLCFDAEVTITTSACDGGPNGDGNLIYNSPYYAVNDHTRAHSDETPDQCDDDLDNDGASNHGEDSYGLVGGVCAGPSGLPTSRTLADSDNDRFLDRAECLLGSSPMNSAVQPALSACGAAADMDGDRLLDRIEYCFYHTLSTVADSDGDGVRDGCEAVSLNTDQVVNSIDQLLLAQEIIRRMGGGAPHVNFDVNKDGNANSADQLLMAQLMIPAGQCP